MAIDFCSSEPPSLCASPRISFSHDLRHEPTNQNYSFQPDSDSTSDFNFWVGGGRTGNEPSPADELFSGGLIMPLQVQEKFENPKQASFKPKAHDFTAAYLPPPSPVFSNFEASKHEIEAANKSHKSFWKIKRSSSVNCDGSHKRSSFWPLPSETPFLNCENKNTNSSTKPRSPSSSEPEVGFRPKSWLPWAEKEATTWKRRRKGRDWCEDDLERKTKISLIK